MFRFENKVILNDLVKKEQFTIAWLDILFCLTLLGFFTQILLFCLCHLLNLPGILSVYTNRPSLNFYGAKIRKYISILFQGDHIPFSLLKHTGQNSFAQPYHEEQKKIITSKNAPLEKLNSSWLENYCHVLIGDRQPCLPPGHAQFGTERIFNICTFTLLTAVPPLWSTFALWFNFQRN